MHVIMYGKGVKTMIAIKKGGNYGPIYLVDQKLGFDPKFGICPLFRIWPDFWDLTQFLGKIQIFGTCNLSDKV